MTLEEQWRARWPEALRLWGRFIRLHDPAFISGLDGATAAFSLNRREVMVDLDLVRTLGLADLPLEVLAHEVGHHVLCPADLTDAGLLLARVRRGLPELERFAPLVQNLYADLLINDRLLRARGLRMAELYLRTNSADPDPLWTFYMRIFEILWAFPAGTLAVGEVSPAMEGDALLGAKLARVYADDWLAGAGGFAALCRRYLEDLPTDAEVERMRCVGVVDGDAQVPGLTRVDDTPIVHPALDPRVNEFAAPAVPDIDQDSPPSGSQYREPFEYGQILTQLGLHLTAQEVAARYYRERALPHLVPFPARRRPPATEQLSEGLGAWDVGEPIEAVDWLASTLRSPVVVPGVTTVQRLTGPAEGDDLDEQPVDLDIYVDSSGSMPNPTSYVSYLALAGAILALSALRAGARVQVTLWSGTNQFTCTDGFVRDERAIFAVLTGFFGGATAFPLHVLRDTYATRDRPTHIVVISDDGVDTMFRPTDERGTPGAEIAAAALAKAGAGGTLLLNLAEWYLPRILELTDGWDVHRVTAWAEVVEFAAAFSRRTYERSTR